MEVFLRKVVLRMVLSGCLQGYLIVWRESVMSLTCGGMIVSVSEALDVCSSTISALARFVG